MTTARVEVDIGGRTVTLTNLGRVMWPAAGLTKEWLVDWYIAISEVLLPHLAGRPLSLARFPEGVNGPGFIQNECRGHPDWMTVRDLRLRDGKIRTYCVVDDVASLAWVANLGTVELHPYLSRDQDDTPSVAVFDLDPQEDADPIGAWQVALLLRDRLAGLGSRAYVKTSGATGLHVYVPLNTPHTFAETRAFARTVAEELSAAHPAEISASTKPRERAGRLFVDWLQNDPRRSTVAPYSLRATELPGVSTPLTWEEVECAVAGAGPMWFTPADVLERVASHGDLFAPVLAVRQGLPALGAVAATRFRPRRRPD